MSDVKTTGPVDSPTLIVSEGGVERALHVQKCKLLAVSGPLQGDEFVIDRDSFTIGSGPHNDLSVEDSTVSRRHCEIKLLPQGYLIRDLGSTNGTIVKGVRVTEAYLSQGSEFQLGNTRLVFCPLQESMEYALSGRHSFGALLGHSIPMRRVFHLAETYAPTDATILIEGETGTGKEILAEEIHKHSHRSGKPFIVIDCAALAKELIESELFGHMKGAFTGANTDRTGAFEHANGGTVFLDEIGDLSPDLQPKLLRVLEKREIRRVGSNQVRRINVRIISATNRRLEHEVNAGHFREDLYYRLSVVHIDIPPLRNRKEDLPMLTEKFLKEFYGENAMEHVANLDRTIETFKNHDWPGNVRELRNLTEIASYSGRKPVDLSSFLYFGKLKSQSEDSRQTYRADQPFKDAKNELISEFEQDYIRDILKRNSGNISRASQEAGIERAYLQRLIRKYKLK